MTEPTSRAMQLEQLDQTLRFMKVSDRELLATYQRTVEEPGNPEADALLAEVERRGLNV